MSIIFVDFGLNWFFTAWNFEHLWRLKTHLGQAIHGSKCIYSFWNEANYSFRPRSILSMHTFNISFGLNHSIKSHHFCKIIKFTKNWKKHYFHFWHSNEHLGQRYYFVSSIPWVLGDSFRPTKAISKLKHSFFMNICYI